MTERTIEQPYANELRGRLDTLVGKLECLAETVRDEAATMDRVGTSRHATYVATVSDVQHAVLWGLVNLNLDGLVTAAADADVAREKGL